MKFLCIFGHKWFYFNPAGVGDYLDRTCSRCERKETYYGNRGYYHDTESWQWMTKKEREYYLKEMERVRKL